MEVLPEEVERIVAGLRGATVVPRAEAVSVTIVDPHDSDAGGHQVLVVGHENGTYQVYEPNTGVWEVSAADLAQGVLPPEVVEEIFGADRFFTHDGYYLP